METVSLAEHLDALAIETWDKVSRGPLSGLEFREDSITDHNLFQLQRHSGLKIYKFRPHEERRSGADWEWWLGSLSEGWLAFRIQAKKLSRGLYPGLRYRPAREDRLQCELLLEGVEEDARGRALFAYYCFYNGWNESFGWPDQVPPPRDFPDLSDIRVFGCALAPAHQVLTVVKTPPTSLDPWDYLPFQRPWSWPLRPRGEGSDGHNARQLLDAMLAAHGRATNDAPPLFDNLPAYVEDVLLDFPGHRRRDPFDSAPVDYVVVTDFGRMDRQRDPIQPSQRP